MLLDLDNTLIDRAALFHGWASDFLKRSGADERDIAWLVEQDGDGLVPKQVFFDTVRTRYGLAATTEALLADYYERYPAFTVAPLTETIDALKKLRERGWRLGIVTNGPPMQEAVVNQSGLRPLLMQSASQQQLA